MRKEQKSVDAIRLIKSVFTGTFLAALIMLILCFLGAVLLSKEVLPEKTAQYMAWGICVVGTLVGCAAAQRKAGSAHLPVSLACGLLLLIVMGAVRTILASGSENSWYCAAIIGACAIISAMLGARGKRRY